MHELLDMLVNLLGRYLHLISMAMLVGGTLFYEAVVPPAIADLKDESQLSVFARARWIFKGIVLIGAVLLLSTGLVSLYYNWSAYGAAGRISQEAPTAFGRVTSSAGLWVLGHAALGGVSLLIAALLVLGRKPPKHPIDWMRLNLGILLVAIFLASVARHVRLELSEEALQRNATQTSGSGRALP